MTRANSTFASQFVFRQTMEEQRFLGREKVCTLLSIPFTTRDGSPYVAGILTGRMSRNYFVQTDARECAEIPIELFGRVGEANDLGENCSFVGNINN